MDSRACRLESIHCLHQPWTIWSRTGFVNIFILQTLTYKLCLISPSSNSNKKSLWVSERGKNFSWVNMGLKRISDMRGLGSLNKQYLRNYMMDTHTYTILHNTDNEQQSLISFYQTMTFSFHCRLCSQSQKGLLTKGYPEKVLSQS